VLLFVRSRGMWDYMAAFVAAAVGATARFRVWVDSNGDYGPSAPPPLRPAEPMNEGVAREQPPVAQVVGGIFRERLDVQGILLEEAKLFFILRVDAESAQTQLKHHKLITQAARNRLRKACATKARCRGPEGPRWNGRSPPSPSRRCPRWSAYARAG